MDTSFAHELPLLVERHSGGEWRILLPQVDHRIAVQLRCSVRPEMLLPLYRWVRPRAPGLPMTFTSMEFGEAPPGLRVGPWPGWRGIPAAPAPDVFAGESLLTVQPQFHGDELDAGVLRLSCVVEAPLPAHLVVRRMPAGMRPVDATAFLRVQRTVEPVPCGLRPELTGVHPRLLGTRQDLDAARARVAVRSGGDLRVLEALLTGRGLPFAVSDESKALPGPERLSPLDRAMITAALAVLAPDAGWTAAALEEWDALRVWALDPACPMTPIDTQCGELLFVLCVVADWLHAGFDDARRVAAREAVDRIAERCRAHLDHGRTDYAQAHWLGCGMGLLAWCFLAWERDARARPWAAELRGGYARVRAMLPDDGSHPHGGNLWIYEYGFLLRWNELLRCCAGEDVWHPAHVWTAASDFRASITTGDLRFGLTFGDAQYRIGGDAWCHWLIAARTGHPGAQVLAGTLADGDHTGIDHRHIPPRRRVYEALWRENTAPTPAHTGGSVSSDRDRSATAAAGPQQDALPQGARFFPDLGQVSIRRGDTLVVCRSGAPIGRQRRASGEPGAYGHADPCNGAFLVAHRGALLVSGAGPVYRRDTAMHSVITVDGRGQIGDGCVWLPDLFPERSIPPDPVWSERDGAVIIECELAPCYLDLCGVRAYRRRITVRRDGGIDGEDAVRLDSVRGIEWNLHTHGVLQEAGGMWLISADDACAELSISADAPIDVRIRNERFVPAYPHDGTVGTHFVAVVRREAVVFRWEIVPCRSEVAH